MQYVQRKKLCARSNNPDNPRKNVCGLAVAKALGVGDSTLYLHTWHDLERAVRDKWSFRSVATAVKAKQGSTIGSIRKNIAAHNACPFYVAMVDGHVLLLDNKGKTLIDTAPRSRDKRKIKAIYGVYFPVKNKSKMQKIAKHFNLET